MTEKLPAQTVSSLSIYHRRKQSRFVTLAPKLGKISYLVCRSFSDLCRLSYVPLVAPATSVKRLQSLASIADSFIYIVSRMGVTGSSANSTMSAFLPELCARVRKYAGNTPIAVGFGVNTREHFHSVGNIADGVVIGSKIVNVIKEAPPGKASEAVLAYCKEISRPRAQHEVNAISHDIGLGESINMAKVDAVSAPTATISTPQGGANGLVDELESLKNLSVNGNAKEYEVLALKVLSDAIETPGPFWGIRRSICTRVFIRLPCRTRAGVCYRYQRSTLLGRIDRKSVV